MTDEATKRLIGASWCRIAELVSSGEVRSRSVRSDLRELDPLWAERELSLVVELSGFAYGRLLERTREILDAHRRGQPVDASALDGLQQADDVLLAVRDLFELVEPEYPTADPVLN